MSAYTFKAPILGRSDYGTRQPEVSITTAEHWRRLHALQHRLAAEIEERSVGHSWVVNCGGASHAGKGLSYVRLYIELAEDTDAEAAAAMRVLREAVAAVRDPDRDQPFVQAKRAATEDLGTALVRLDPRGPKPAPIDRRHQPRSH